MRRRRISRFEGDWARGGEEEKDRTIDDLMSAMMFFLFVIVVALLMLYTPENAGGRSTSVWPPGTPLRFEARRDFNLQGGFLSSGNCLTVNGEMLGDIKHYSAEGTIKPEFVQVYKMRPFECSSSDHDLYAQYVSPDGETFKVLSHDSKNSAEGAFAYSTPRYDSSDNSPKVAYRDRIQSQMFRTEEITYREKYLKPGTYTFNVHLSKPDIFTPDWDVIVGVYLIVAEGTKQEQVVFHDFVTLNMRDGEREKTVVSFRVDERGNIIPDSIDYDTQVRIAER